MTEPAVAITGLTVRRGGRAVLDALDLRLPAACIIGLLGPSGSGKSTLLRSIVGVQRVTSGEVTVLGEAAGSRPLRHRVGYVTQAPSVYDDLTVVENLRYFAAVLGVGRERIDAVLDQVRLTPMRSRLVSRLSGGQLSRVSLAAALLGSPELLVLDEPTVGLDPVLRGELWQSFRELADAGITLLVSSHVMDEAERCDRLVLMRDGAILADGRREELLRQTGTASAEAAFLALVERGLDARPDAGSGSGSERGAA